MKNILYVFSSVILVIILIINIIPQNNNIIPQPLDVIVVDEEDESSHLEKQKWIEEMHLAAPGVNWRRIDQQNKEELRISRRSKRMGKSSLGPVDIAYGRLIGEWVEKGSHNLAGRMRCIDVDFENGHIYGASDGGQIWRGNMQGEEWTSLSDYNHVKGLVFIRVMKKEDGSIRVMMANNNGSMSGSNIFQYSDDQGENWIGANGLRMFKGNNLVRALTQPDGTIYLLMLRSGRSYILRSNNQGSDFTEVDNIRTSGKVDIWTPRFDMDSLYLIDKTELYVLNDQDELVASGKVGINFSDDGIERIQMNGCISEGNTYLYVMYRLDKSTRFFGSVDGGKTWTSRGELDKGPFMSNSFGVSTVNPLLMGFGEVNAYRSIDGGVNWQLINTWGEYYGDIVNKLHADIPEIEFIRKPNGGELCFVSTDGGTYLSDNGLEGVKNISLKGLHISQYYTTYTHRENTDIIYAGSQDQGFQRSVEHTDGVATFEQTISGDYGHIVSSDGGKSLWTVYPGFAMRYPSAAGSNSMVTWDFTGDNHFWMPPLMEDPYFPERVYLGGGTSTTGNHLWYLDHRTTGISVTELPYDFSDGTSARISAMGYSPINKDYRYVLNSEGKFFYSSDRGTTWEKSSNRGPGSHYFYGNSIIPDVKDINTIYIGGSGYSGHSVWVSKDGGKSFDPMSSGLPNTLVFEMAINEDGTLLFAATEIGPFVWISSENSWYDLAGGTAPEQTYWSVDYVPALRTARFGTYGRGIWDFKITEYTGMDDLFVHEESIGVNIYPNPVVNQSNIESYLPESGDMLLRVINSSGKIVEEYKFDNLPAGKHTTAVNVQNLPSGIYYVQISLENRTTIRKLMKK